MTVTNCSFTECGSGISGGSEWYDYGSEYPIINYSNCTFKDCGTSTQFQYWVNDESEIPTRFASYTEESEGNELPGNYYYNGSMEIQNNTKNYRFFYTYNGDGNYSDSYIFWFR